MRKSSKLLWIALVVVVTMVVTALGAMAAESTAVIYGDVVNVGDATSFDVGFSFKENNQKVECGKITLTWNAAKMTATAVTPDSAIAGAAVDSKIEAGKVTFAWAGSAIAADTAAGDLFTVSFDKGSIADGEMAMIDITVDAFGYTDSITAYDFADSVTANNAYATAGTVLKYDATVTDEPEVFLHNAVLAAEATGTTVDVLLEKEMTFDAKATIGVPGATHTGKVNVYSTMTNGTTPDFGITVYSDLVINFYGNFNFDMVTLNNTLKGMNGKDQSWSSGGCLNFVEGLGVFGHDETVEGQKDWGTIKSTRVIHLSGHVETYTGTYWTVSGNFYNTGLTIKNPRIKFAGNSTASYLFGGAHNGGTNTKISGPTDLDILDAAAVTSRAVVGDYYTGQTQGADVYVNSTGLLPEFWMGNYMGASSVTYSKDRPYNIVIDYINAGAHFNIHRAQAGSAENYKGNITINDGVFGGYVFFGIDGRQITNSMAFKNADITVTINGGTYNKGNVYFGSRLNETNTTPINKSTWETGCVRNITVNGGTYGYTMYGGSYITTGGTSYHNGTTNMTVSGGTFKSIYGGSYIKNATAYHNGETTLTIQGATDGKMITVVGHIMGGSQIEAAGAKHKGNTTVYVQDLNTYLDSEGNPDGNYPTLVYNMTISSGMIFGGSQLSQNGEHSGNSTTIVRRNYYNKVDIHGGSRLDGTTALHTGTSKLIIDGNTGWVTEGDKQVQKEGQNGWGYYYAAFYGGSHLNGYLAGASTSDSHQTGDSFVEIVGPADYVSNQAFHRLRINGNQSSKAVYGGHNFAAQKMTTPQMNDSTVTIKNKLERVGSNMQIYGGSYYNTRVFDYTNNTVVPTSKVIIDGTYDKVVIGGFNTRVNATATYNQNSAVILKSGRYTGTPYPMSWVDGTAYTSAKVTQRGVALYEIHGAAAQDNDTYAISALTACTVTERGVKVVGTFNDADKDGYFTLKTNLGWSVLDMSQARGSNFRLINTKTNANAQSKTIERINESKYIKFATSASTKTNVTEITVNPGMKYADILKTSGLNIYFNFDPAKSGTVYPWMNSYADIVKYDSVSLSPNAFKFYAVNEDGSRGEEITNKNISMDPNAKVIVQCGNDNYTSSFLLDHTFKIANKSVSLASNLIMNYKIPQSLETDYGYTITKAEVTFAGQTDTIYYDKDAEGNAVLDKSRYVFKFADIAPQGIADDMTVVVYATYNDGEKDVEVKSQALKFGVIDYCYGALNNSAYASYTNMQTLIVDLLNYGTAAQQYNNYNTENLANADLTDEQKALASADTVLEGLEDKKNVAIETIETPTATITPSLTLGNSIMVRYRVNLPTGTDLANIKLVVVNKSDADRTWDFKSNAFVSTGKADEYYVYVSYLNAEQVSDVLYATVYDGANAISNTCQYTVESYVVAAQATTAENYATLRTLTAAMMKYGIAAANYAANPTA